MRKIIKASLKKIGGFGASDDYRRLSVAVIEDSRLSKRYILDRRKRKAELNLVFSGSKSIGLEHKSGWG